jgi:hypothetical protein
MKNPASLRRKLRTARAEHAIAAAEKTVSGGTVDEDIKQLDVYEKLLAALPRSGFYERYPAMLIAGICLLAASVAWTIRVPTTKIHLGVKTMAVSVRLATPLAWEGRWRVGGAVVRLQEFTTLELPPELSAPPQLTGRAWLDIAGGVIKLTRLDMSQGALVSVMSNASGDVDILTLNKPFQGELAVAGSPRISAGPAPDAKIPIAKATFDPPATVTFDDAGRQLIPARLRASPLEKLRLRRVPIHALSLFTETMNADQQSSFTSGITEGAVTLSDTGEAIELKAGDPLYLKGVNGIITGLEIGPDGLQLWFDGEVHGVSLGTPGFERNLKPTLLEYLYHREKLGFFWGAVTFLWGLIWSGRKLFSA